MRRTPAQADQIRERNIDVNERNLRRSSRARRNGEANYVYNESVHDASDFGSEDEEGSDSMVEDNYHNNFRTQMRARQTDERHARYMRRIDTETGDENGGSRRRRLRRNDEDESEEEEKREEPSEFVPSIGEYSLAKKEDGQEKEQTCGLCKREGVNLVGPFAQQMAHGQDTNYKWYFHNECLERNEFTALDDETQRWIGIKTCLEKLIIEESMTCSRCALPGATIMCKYCETAYHGYRCSEIFMARNYEGALTCLKCFSNEIETEFDEDKKKKIESSLWTKNTSIYKDFPREQFELTEITEA